MINLPTRSVVIGGLQGVPVGNAFLVIPKPPDHAPGLDPQRPTASRPDAKSMLWTHLARWIEGVRFCAALQPTWFICEQVEPILPAAKSAGVGWCVSRISTAGGGRKFQFDHGRKSAVTPIRFVLRLR